jgi:hypothetical protein
MEATTARSRIDPAKLLSRLGACREATADAAYAAAADAYAAYAAYAAAAADADAARTKVRRQCADLVRARIPWTKVAAAIKGKE